MADQSKPDLPLNDTGQPDDPAKKENLDTRLDQEKPFHDKESEKKDAQDPDAQDPALETTRIAGQGTG